MGTGVKPQSLPAANALLRISKKAEFCKCKLRGSQEYLYF